MNYICIYELSSAFLGGFTYLNSVSQVSHALYLPDLMLQLDCLSLHWFHEQCPTLLSQREAKAKARFNT
jgi:hypothetical protein